MGKNAKFFLKISNFSQLKLFYKIIRKEFGAFLKVAILLGYFYPNIPHWPQKVAKIAKFRQIWSRCGNNGFYLDD